MAVSTFTAGPGDYARPYFQHAGTVRIRTFFEGASQTFVRGEPLIQSSDSHQGNAVKVAANDPTTLVIGHAAQGATGSQMATVGAGSGGWGSRTDITALAAGNAFSLGFGVAGSLGNGIGGNYEPTASGSSQTLTGNGATKGLVPVWLLADNTAFVARVLNTIAISNDKIGAQVGFEKDTNFNIWRVDDADTSNKCVQIVGLWDLDGDVNGKYVYKWVAAANLLFGER